MGDQLAAPMLSVKYYNYYISFCILFCSVVDFSSDGIV
jgi:hypothetical protein